MKGTIKYYKKREMNILEDENIKISSKKSFHQSKRPKCPLRKRATLEP